MTHAICTLRLQSSVIRALPNNKWQVDGLKLLSKTAMWLGRIRKGGSNHSVCMQTVDNCLFKGTLQRIAQPLRWGMDINQEPPDPVVQSKAPPHLNGQVDSIPPPRPVYSYPPLPGVGEGHLCGVQLAVLISRCQGFEHDLAHQLVGTRQTRESLYHCPQGPSPRNKTQ